MSGNRVNPNSDDDIMRVRLGEKRELGRQTDGTLVQIITDGYYEMNFRTGESYQINTNQRIMPANINFQRSN